MWPSLSQLRLWSLEDLIIYRKWLRRSVIFYGTALALLVLAVGANYLYSAVSSGLAEGMHRAAIAARK